MKKFLIFIAASVVIVTSAFSVFKLTSNYRMNVLNSNLCWSIDAKNCKSALGFDKDDRGNTYIVYKDYIKVLRSDGREKVILENGDLNIENILYHDDNLYFLSDDKLMKYDIEKDDLKTLISNIPCKGQYNDRNLIIKNSNLLLSIGSATNSGIADLGKNGEIKDSTFDKSPINLVLNGVNYGENKTGAFMAYGNSSSDNQKIEAQSIGNASIIKVNLKTYKYKLYACGIRNITGWDTDSDNNLISIIGGMEDTGERAVKRDADYIYKIDEGKWYGWPDFSGGDPITSPRFKEEKKLQPIIKNPPNKIVSAPMYQFEKPGIIKFLTIDKSGDVLPKDTKVYLNKDENLIQAITNDKVMFNLLKLKSESDIRGIKYVNGNIYILDSGIGCIYKLQSSNSGFAFNLPKSICIFLIVFSCVFAGVLILKKVKIK